MHRIQQLKRRAAPFLAAALLAGTAAQAATDDTALFSTTIPPNVVMIVDNSGSMNNVVWHPAYDPTVTPTCTFFNNSATYQVDSSDTDTSLSYSDTTMKATSYSISKAGCVTTSRLIYEDPSVKAKGNRTWWEGQYLNWYFSSAADPYYATIVATANGTYSTCLGGGTYSLYRRARVTAAQDILREVICQVNQKGAVRFGLAQFRTSISGESYGGYVRVPANNYLDSSGNPNVYTLDGVTQSHGAHINDFINVLDAETSTPLGETLFQVYTYFMSRNAADRPKGVDGVTTFPEYHYRTAASSNGAYNTSGPPTVPDSPVQYSCQKNFVIIITDGEPTRDDFQSGSTSVDEGFNVFDNLIGDYVPDGEVERSCGTPSGCAGWFLDDIAKFMQDTDFRPDLPAYNGQEQVIDTYTVGFTTSPLANSLLQRTANNGNGQFYFSNDPDSLANAIISAVADIIQKSQSFTAATVPATRTAAGGEFYTSLFVPSRDAGYWEGHLKSWTITSAGDILDKNGNCALNDPGAPAQCVSGAFSGTAVPFWDAGVQVSAMSAGSRNLRTTKLVSGTPTMLDFTTANLTAADMNITAADIPLYDTTPYAAPTTAAQLKDMVVDNLRGCELGTTGGSCVERSWKLGDIFHSDPVVVPGPASYLADPDFKAFQTTYKTRKRVILAGDNDGFARFIDAGTWQTATVPPGYDHGTGDELMGFMPYATRQIAKQLPIDDNGRNYYGVDGSPSVADVWFYTSASANAPHDGTGASGWRTVAVTGLRQGGNAYFALDITNPAATSCTSPATGSGYPCYLWEFPVEGSVSGPVTYMGQTWSEPVITRIKVNPSVLVPTAATPGYDRWVAVFAGGYDPTSDPNESTTYDPLSKKGRAIVIVDLKTGKVIAEKKFDATSTTATTNPSTVPYDPLYPERSMHYAMTATPGVYDLDFDGYADVIYVPDLGGNIWKWVVNGIGQDPVNGVGSTSQPNWPFRKFFSAPTYTTGGTTYYKSFFNGPAATLKSGKLWLALGTGERANLGFPGITGTTAENNRLYSMTDLDPKDTSGSTTALMESDLTDLTGNATCASLGTTKGFYFIGVDGEKFITRTDIFFYIVLTASYTPQQSLNPCTSNGLSALYAFEVSCGKGLFVNTSSGSPVPSVSTSLGAGMPTAPQVTISADGGGYSGSGTGASPNRVIINNQDGEVVVPGAGDNDGDGVPDCPGANCPCPNWPSDCPLPDINGGIGQFYWREM